MSGLGPMAGLIWRRDRIRLTVWAYVLIALVAGTARSIGSLAPTVSARRALAASIDADPAIRAVTGAIFDPTSVGGLTAWRVMSLGGIVVAIMSILTVVRHTRAEEESGRAELVGAGAVERHAPLVAALLVVTAVNLVAGAVSAVLLIVFGLGTAGSLALGLGIAVTGIAFAGLAGLAAQVTQGARAANGVAFTALAIAFVLRAVGDAGSTTWPRWLSPLGWAEVLRPYAGQRWWVLALPVALGLACTAVSVRLAGSRDLGSGLLSARRGRATAAGWLRGPFGLALRQQRATLLGWGVGMLAYGALVGGSADGVVGLVTSSDRMESVLRQLGGGGGLVAIYLAASFSIGGLFVAAYGVQAALRTRSEEAAGRLEPVLATAAGRRRWMAGHLAIAMLGCAALLAASGVAAGLAYGGAIGDVGGQVPRLLGASLVAWPAVIVPAALVAAGFGLAPRAAAGAWAALGVFALLGQVGTLLRLPQAVLDVSPFAHVPKLPGATVTSLPLVMLALIAAVLAAAGLLGFGRRDVPR